MDVPDPDSCSGGAIPDENPRSTETRTTAPARGNGSGDAELERTLGFGSALSLGLGTMIGAGIFVFPGIAAGEAGPAATLSFALGAVVAILVALSASELATAMPESGGGYYFVSRALGARLGAMVGLGQWVGLIFASAFYLVGTGHYLAETARTLGWSGDLSPPWIGFGTALLLTGISLVGTRKAGSLQNVILTVLLSLLTVFLVYGVMTLAGLTAVPAGDPGPFFPYGVLPVFTTGAMVFTSYLGFAQIAAVAGEIKEPQRTIPLAMLTSVFLVGLLYVTTVFIGTTLLSPERMGELGETAMVEVARTLAGRVGVTGFLVGGILATLSSANASILSSSRSVFALGQDDLVPEGAGAINERFRTPHVALLLAGLPIAGLTLLGRIDVLAEVASLLHLVLYGLMCFALIALRRRDPEGYAPTFRCPGYPVVPLLGGISSFALLLFMERISQVIGAIFIVLTLLWYAFYATDVQLKETSS